MSTSVENVPPRAEPADFSLMLGGPLYQFYLRTRMARDPLDLAARRTVIIPALAWVPLLVLSLLEGHVWSGVAIPFLHDLEVHARYLIALPLLIAGELIVHQRTSDIVARFVTRGIVPPSVVPRFNVAVASALRLRNSMAFELLLIASVLVIGHYVWQRQVTLHAPTWWAPATTPETGLSWAGWWYVYIAIPVYQFIMLRWYFRLVVWFRFLGHVSRLDLKLIATHPDRAAGLGFLGHTAHAFGPLLFAQGVLLSALIANRILRDGGTLLDYQYEVVAIVVVLMLFVLAPLLQFTPRLLAAKRAGMHEYGDLASEYVNAFENKWIRRGAPPGETLVGSADIQSLADLANSFEVVRTMRPTVFPLETLIRIAIVTVLPVSPLILTVIPLNEIIRKLLAVLL